MIRLTKKSTSLLYLRKILILMFETKLTYLQEQISHLKQQNAFLVNLLSPMSQENQNSLIFQLKQQNTNLSLRVGQLKDELLLEKNARQIQLSLHEETVEDYNSVIFELKQQIKKLENIVKAQGKVKQQLGAIEQWFRNKLNMAKDEIFHKYADPILFFNLLQEILKAVPDKDHTETSLQITIQNMTERNVSNNEQDLMQRKWFEEESQIYFMRKKRKQNLHLRLNQAKIIQFQQNLMRFGDGRYKPLENIKLLKQSYVDLIAEHQKLRKKIKLYQRYIQQLQNRNKLLIASHTIS